MKRTLSSLGILALAILVAPAAEAASPKRGADLAAARCGSCHAVGKTGASPNIKAPTLRRVARQWPLDQLQESLAEGIVTGHPGMPEFTFEPREIDDFLAYLARLRR